MVMASYVCPQLTVVAADMPMLDGMPCGGMDAEKPVQCAQFNADVKGSFDHLNAAPALTQPSLATLFRVFLPPPQIAPPVAWMRSVPAPEDDPPYLRTLRIRI